MNDNYLIAADKFHAGDADWQPTMECEVNGGGYAGDHVPLPPEVMAGAIAMSGDEGADCFMQYQINVRTVARRWIVTRGIERPRLA